MSTRRRTWLFRVGLALLMLIGVIGGLAARYASQRAEHQRLRDQELGRAPVAAPKRATPTSLPLAASATSCVTGLVLDHGTPVSGMQVSVSDAPLSVSGDCPCEKPTSFCGCREGLLAVQSLPRAGLVEAVKSAVTGAGGRFELCGLEGEGLRLIWGEHLDGRLATPPPEQSPLIKPGAAVELHVLALLPVRGVVLADQTPVPNATVLAFGSPPFFLRTLVTDARGRFEARLPLGMSTFVVAAEGFGAQRVEQLFDPQQVLVLRLKREGHLTVRALYEGRPVAGAEVTVGSEPSVVTDASGVAPFPLQVASRKGVRVTKGELIGTTTVTVLEGLPKRIDVALEKGVRLRGVVVDEQGPRAGARVRGLGKGKPILSDEAGRFTSELLLPSGELHPIASAEGCADSEYRAIATDEPNVTLTLACAETANGSVLDAEGKPVEGAVVLLDGLEANESVTTEAAGTFRFHQPKGMYQLKVSHDRYRAHEQPLQLPAKDVVIVLDAGGSISGRVVNGKGEGVAGASVTVVPAVLDALLSEVEGGNTRATTDAEGRFAVPGLLAGRLVASATADSLGTVVSDVVVLQPGEHKEGLVLTLEERVDLSGTVLDEQRRPIPGARVKWDPADEKSALMGVLMDAVRGHVDQVLRYMPSPSITDVDGRYVLRGLPVSQVKLDVSAAGYADVEQVASRGDTLDFVLKKTGGRVRGRVIDEASHPLTTFSVDGAAFTPDDGRFEVESFGNDDTLSVSATGFSLQSVKVEMDGGAVKDVGDVVMKKGRQLQLEVRGPDGKPLPGVKVAAVQSIDGDSCTTKADGRCVIEPLLDVETRVKAAKDGFAPVSLTVEAGKIDQPLSITLAAASGRITGVAFAAPGQPAPARNVFLSGEVFKGVLTDGEGRFAADGLPEGRYCATLDSRSVRGLEWAVAVQASATPTQVLVGPAAQGAVLVGARTLPGRLVLLQGTAAPMDLSRVLEATASNLCDSLGSSAITTITTGDFRVEGVPPGRWSVFFVSFSQLEEKGEAKPVLIDLGAGDTKTLP